MEPSFGSVFLKNPPLECIKNLLDSSNFDEKSLGQIFDEINKAKEQYDDIKQIEKSSLMIGMTDSGKTTLSAFLSSVILKAVEDKQTPGKFSYIYENKNETRKIGESSTESETMYPNQFICKDGSVFWDCPGFLDSRGEEIQIIQAYHINSISRLSKQIRFILVVDVRSLDEKGYGCGKSKDFKEIFEVLNIMTKRQNIDLSKHLAIVFSKATKSLDFYKKKMCQLYDDLMSTKGFINKLMRFFQKNDLSVFFDSMKKANYLIFPSPNDQGMQISSEDFLKQLEKTQFSEMIINMPISISCLDTISSLWNVSREKITRNFSLIFEEFGNSIDLMHEKDVLRINEIYINYENKFMNKPPVTNEQFLKLFNSEIIKPFLDNFDKDKKISQKIEIYIKEIFFLGIEIYDKILSKIDISDECSQFFGILGSAELLPGKTIFLEKLEKRKEKDKQTNEDQEEEKQNSLKKIKEELKNKNAHEKEVQRKLDQANDEINRKDAEAKNLKFKLEENQNILKQKKEAEDALKTKIFQYEKEIQRIKEKSGKDEEKKRVEKERKNYEKEVQRMQEQAAQEKKRTKIVKKI